MRIHIKYLFFFFVAAFLLTGCEDVIDVKIDDAPTLLVVDAWLTNQQEIQTISLASSTSYFEDGSTSPVAGATVSVVNSAGTTFNFTDQGSGQYTWTPSTPNELGTPGTEYTLSISWDGKMYSSTTTMFPVPPVDSITQEFRDDELSGIDGIYCEFFARDLVGEGNTYWIKTFKNEVFLNKPSEINIAFDAAFAGSSVDGLIFIPPLREAVNRIPDSEEVDDEIAPWEVGDNIRVEIHSISLMAYNFWDIARDQMTNGSNGIFALPLANTNGNVVDQSTGAEVLGMFNVAAVSSLEQDIE